MSQTHSVQNKSALKPYKTAISRYFRSALALQGVTYLHLSERLARRGIVLTPENLRNKVARGLIPADLLIVMIEELNDREQALNAISRVAHSLLKDTE